MAVTNQVSTQVQRGLNVPPDMNDVQEDGGRVRLKAFDFTQVGVGDANSTVALVKIPGGKVRVKSFSLKTSALGASRVASIGASAYKNASNTTVTQNLTAFGSAIDVSAAGWKAGEINSVVESKSGFQILLQVTGGTIPDGATLNGYVEYVLD